MLHNIRRSPEQFGQQPLGQFVEHTDDKHADVSLLHVTYFSLAKSSGLVASLGFTADTVHVFTIATPPHLHVSAAP